MSQSTPTQPPRRGRPPSAAARAKALRAAHDILMDEGLGRLTIEGVAARSGVGKPTIYRHWANAQELALEALTARFDTPGAPGVDGAGQGASLEAGLREQFRALARAFSTTRGRQIARSIASADPESEFTRAFRNRVILASREAGRGMIEAAVQRGEAAPPPDIEALLDMLYAPVFYRVLLGHAPLDDAFAEGLVTMALRALRR